MTELIDPAAPPAGWLTTAQAADRVGVSPRTMYGWIRAGQVDARADRIGRWWVSSESLAVRAAWPRRRGPQPRPNHCPSCGYDLRRDLADHG